MDVRLGGSEERLCLGVETVIKAWVAEMRAPGGKNGGRKEAQDPAGCILRFRTSFWFFRGHTAGAPEGSFAGTKVRFVL